MPSSWDDIFEALFSHDNSNDQLVTSLLSSDYPTGILTQTFPSFPGPSPATATAFKSDIEAIPPSSDGLYNRDELVEDALWLSKQLNLSEEEALRLTLLEYQYRPEFRLQQGYSEAEIASLKEALGADYVDKRLQLREESGGRNDGTFNSQNSRRTRLIQLYLDQQVLVLRLAKDLSEIKCLPDTGDASHTSPRVELANLTRSDLGRPRDVVTDAIDRIRAYLQSLESVPSWSVDEPQFSLLKDARDSATLHMIKSVLQIVLLTTRSSEVKPDGPSVVSWFRLMSLVEYFASFNSDTPDQAAAIQEIQSTASLITLIFLDLGSTIEKLTSTASSGQTVRPGTREEYFFDHESVSQLQEILERAGELGNPQAGPAVLAWSIIVNHIKQLAFAIKENRESHHVQRSLEAPAAHRTSSGSSSSFQTSIFEDLWDSISLHSANDDPPNLLSNLAIDQCHVIDYAAFLCASAGSLSTMLPIFRLQALQELVAVAQPFMSYTPELVSLQLALLTPNPNTASEKALYNPAVHFIQDEFLLSGFYDMAAARFPFECVPFLRFSRLLAEAPIFSEDGTQYIEHRLRRLPSFTQAAINGIHFSTTREDENGLFVVLDEPINLLDLSNNKLLTYRHQETETTSIIPTNTIGELISDPDGPVEVIRWQHEYPGLAYMGQLLELHCLGRLPTILSEAEDPRAVASEITGLLTTLLSTILDNPIEGQSTDDARKHCLALLDEVSANLNPEADAVVYIFDILEQELQSFRRRTTSVFDCRILNSSLDFIIVLCRVRPRLIWSNLSRTSLLGHQSASSPILGIVSAVEVPLQTFGFLEKCTELYQSLIQLSVGYANAAASSTTRPLTRSALPAAWRTQSPLLAAATEAMYQIYQNVSEWSFQNPNEQLRITTSIADSFADIIRYAFGVGNSLESTSSATTPFVEAATYLVSSFRESAPQEVGLDPLVRLFFAIGNTEKSAMENNIELDRHADSTMALAALLSRYGQLRDWPLSSLEKHIFDAVPCLVRTLQKGSLTRVSCLRLLYAILTYVDRHQPSSLLGHLGSSSGIDLLNLLRHIQMKSESQGERAQIWKLLTLFVKDSQQWLAMVILTGSAPDGSKRPQSQEKPNKCLRGKTFLQIAVEELRMFQKLPKKVTIAILEFILEAMQNWSWVAKDLTNAEEEFYSNTIRSLFGPDQIDGTEWAEQNVIAALMTDIATTHLHHAKVSRDEQVIKIYGPLFSWLSTHAVDVSSYNVSLHTNLPRNFSAKYDWLTVSDIKNTGLDERHYGPNFFYNIKFADKLMEHDQSWQGVRGRSQHQSFSTEFRRANINLSLVDSELRLLSSLQRLCVDHCRFVIENRKIQRSMATIVKNCLHRNSQVYPTEGLFESLFQTRADLSMALLRELAAYGAVGSDFLDLLEHAWEAVRFRSGSYEQAIANNDLTYWRSILSDLLLAIQFHVYKDPKAPLTGGEIEPVVLAPEIPTILGITTAIVADGFRSVVLALQDQKERKLSTVANDKADLAGPRDVSLLLTFMQTILRLPSLPQFSAELSDRLSSSGIISSCLVLYSWSHLLTGPELDHQPRYADCCVQLLASISSLPPVAEELAVEGVLNRLLSAKTTETLQRVPGGASHVDARPNCVFLYRIWATGILPLCLNLLHAVGGAIAPEISVFLNQFPDQLARASTALMPTPPTKAAASDVLTLSVASEAATLALISYGLTSFRSAGASAAVDPTTILPLKGYDEHRTAILEDVRDLVAMKDEARHKMTVPTNEKEVGWQNARDAEGGNKLDAKIVTQLKMATVALRRDEDDDDEGK